MDTTPFAIEAGVCMFFAIILQCIILRQLYHDINEREKWRPLVVCHWLIEAASIWQVIGNLDSQAGLGIYSQAFILFISNIRSVLLFASCRALASSFVASYQLMTQGPASSGVPMNLVLAIGHGVVMGLGLVLFLVLLATRNAWVAVVSRLFISAYSLLVSAQIVDSSWKVRKILVDEHKRVQKYSEGIKKLTRLIVLVCILVLIGNVSLYVGLAGVIEIAKTVGTLPEGRLPFSGLHIFSDVVGIVTVFALIMGSWTVKRKESAKSGSKVSKHGARTTRSSTTGDRKSTPKGTSREMHEASPSETNSSEAFSIQVLQETSIPVLPQAAPTTPKSSKHSDDSLQRKKWVPVSDDLEAAISQSILQNGGNDSSKLRGNEYQELDIV